MAAFYPGGVEEGKLFVSTGGWPNQFKYGFNGLLPVHTAFNYWISPEIGEIIGVFDGRSSIGGFGNMVIGSIDELEKIMLQETDGSKINCDIETLESNDPLAKQWKFICPVTKPNISGPYFYPIKVTFGTDKGEKISSEGNLFGSWKQDIKLSKTIFPFEVSESLKNVEEFEKLVEDHQIILYSFDAKVDQTTGNLSDGMNADIVLLGHMAYKGRTLPYSVTTSMGVENGKVVRWDLDELELQDLITYVLNEKITNNLIGLTQEPILNLYYFEASKFVDIGYFEGSTFSGSNWFRLVECKGHPWEETLPNITKPLMEFSVNGGWDKRNAQLVLFKDGVRLLHYSGLSSADENNPISYLLPSEMVLPNREPIGIWAQFTWGPYISLSYLENTTPSDVNAYKEVFEELPGTKEFFDWGVTIKDTIFAVNKEGKLDLVACDKIKP